MDHRWVNGLPIEFDFAVKCCQWNFQGGARAEPAEPGSQFDWQTFLETCRRHRIQGLVWNCLHSVGYTLPERIRAALAHDARCIAEDGLTKALASAELLGAFVGAGVPLLFLKGLTVGKLAYGNPFLKAGWDIDVLVPREGVFAAGRELEGLGYRLIIPAVSVGSEQFDKWHQVNKESVWKAPNGIVVELHSRLANNDRLIPGIDALSPARQVEVGPGVVLPTLDDERLFAYLSVHGASSAWFRLKWITDFAALIAPCTSGQIEQHYVRSQRMAAGRAASQALLLANRLYGTPIAPRFANQLDTQTNALLAWVAIQEMTNLNEPTERPLGTAIIHLSQLLMQRGLEFKFSELRRQAFVALNRLTR